MNPGKSRPSLTNFEGAEGLLSISKELDWLEDGMVPLEELGVLAMADNGYLKKKRRNDYGVVLSPPLNGSG